MTDIRVIMKHFIQNLYVPWASELQTFSLKRKQVFSLDWGWQLRDALEQRKYPSAIVCLVNQHAMLIKHFEEFCALFIADNL
jgi:hypothetical protein